MIAAFLYSFYIYWIALITNAWFVVFIPVWVGCIFGLFHKSWNPILWGLFSFIISSTVGAILAIFFLKM